MIFQTNVECSNRVSYIARTTTLTILLQDKNSDGFKTIFSTSSFFIKSVSRETSDPKAIVSQDISFKKIKQNTPPESEMFLS